MILSIAVHDHIFTDEQTPFSVRHSDIGFGPYYSINFDGIDLHFKPERLAELHTAIGSALDKQLEEPLAECSHCGELHPPPACQPPEREYEDNGDPRDEAEAAFERAETVAPLPYGDQVPIHAWPCAPDGGVL